MKTTMSILAIAGLVLALAPAALAAPVTVLNPSFESPDTPDATGAAPDNWTKFGEQEVFVDGRFSYDYAGPTDGDQVLVLDDRSPWAPGSLPNGVYQSLGTGASLKAMGPTLVATFDARKGGNQDQDQQNRADVGFFAYFTVNGVKDTTDDLFVTHADGSALRKATVIRADTGRNMDAFSISIPTAGLDDGAEVRLYFEVQWEMDGSSQSTQSRTFIDNVQVVPEPATMSVLAIGGIALLRRKRR